MSLCDSNNIPRNITIGNLLQIEPLVSVLDPNLRSKSFLTDKNVLHLQLINDREF